MKLRFWKKNQDIDTFAVVVANDLYSHVPPDEIRDYINGMLKDQRKARRRIEQKIDAVIFEMQTFIREQSLGIYGKARLQKALNERLVELGYDKAVTKRLGEMLLFRALTGKSGESGGE